MGFVALSFLVVFVVPIFGENFTSQSSGARPNLDAMSAANTSDNLILKYKLKCAGTCHGSVMSLFCEFIDTQQACGDGEFCCIRRPTTTPAPSTPPTVPECRGYCTPLYLSGLCYRPARLILRTLTCEVGTICCDNSIISDTDHIEEMNREV